MSIMPFAEGQPGTVELARIEPDPLSRIADWVAAAREAEALVTRIVDTPFLPAWHWPDMGQGSGKYPVTVKQRQDGRPFAIAGGTAAILQGATLGLDPLTALAKIYVVHGAPGLFSKLKVALAQSKGHEVWTEEWSDTRAIVSGRRRGTDRIESVTVTMDMARKAGWTRNKTYENTPADMLWNRAAGRVCDRIAGDVLFGIASAEELVDEPDPEPAARRVSAARRLPRADTPALPAPAATAAPAAAAAPSRPAPAGPDAYAARAAAPVPPPHDESTAPSTASQWTAINDRFKNLGVTGDGMRERRRRVCEYIVGRELTDGREMSSAEANLVLNNLRDDEVAQTLIRQANEPAASDPAPAGADDHVDEQEEFDPTMQDDWPTGGESPEQWAGQQ